MYGYIYITTNNVNNKKYIGQRKGEFDLNYYGSGKIISQAVVKYGEENFSVEMLEQCESREKLNECERWWINHFDAVNRKDFYNIAKGGEGGHTIAGYNDEQKSIYSKNMSKSLKGRTFTDEHKHKISESLKNANLKRKGKDNPFYGKKHSDETKRKIAETKSKQKGWHHSDEAKRKIGEANRNRIVSKETRLKMSISARKRMTGKKHSEETKRKIGEASKVKVAITLNEKTTEFNSVSECAIYLKEKFNLSSGTLKLLLRNGHSFEPKQARHQDAKGLTIKYLQR